MINLQGWEPGDQFVKCVYFFQLYFLFFTITIFFRYVLDNCMYMFCSLLTSFELVLKVNMNH